MLLGGHKWLGARWEETKKRGLATDGYIHRIEPGMWAAEDKQKWRMGPPAMQSWRDRDILIGLNEDARIDRIKNIRNRMMGQAKNNMATAQSLERKASGRKFYWYCKNNGINDVSDDDENPASDIEAA
ncbi:MAG: hypothetical protein Q9182_004517 [Xanthomendoza sp. 2 TL-2023]